MLAAVYGQFEPRSSSGSLSEQGQDPYGLFQARSMLLGWLQDASVGAAPDGLWGMNEAEVNLDPQWSEPTAWFQVVLTDPRTEKLLPTQQFLACVDDVISRLGNFRLESLELLLPRRRNVDTGKLASQSGERISSPLLAARNWFADRDPVPKISIRLTLDGGPDPLILDVAQEVVEWINAVQELFLANSTLFDEDDHLILWPAPLDKRDDFAHHRFTIHGTIPEWSLDMLAWLADLLADGVSRRGIDGTLIVAVSQ
jgi:hypothetical protein